MWIEDTIWYNPKSCDRPFYGTETRTSFALKRGQFKIYMHTKYTCTFTSILDVNKYIYIHMCKYIYIYIHMYIYICICVYVYMCIYIYVYVYMCTCVYVYLYVCMYVCMHACMHACIYICKCMALYHGLTGETGPHLDCN